MNKPIIVNIAGIPFNVANCLSGLIAAIVVFCFAFFLSRKITMRPNKRQNLLEWVIDFTNGIVKSAMPGEEGKKFYLLSFVLFLFIFMSNQLGLFLNLTLNRGSAGDFSILKSPTADPVVTMTFAMVVLLLSHYYAISKFGFKGYLGNYLRPVSFLLPINILEEFTNFLTLSLRLYGNIFAGEVLLDLLAKLAMSKSPATWLVGLPLEMVWQGFSVFIGSIQAFVFVTLGMVYISRKIERE